jgi:hypothetical protein
MKKRILKKIAKNEIQINNEFVWLEYTNELDYERLIKISYIDFCQFNRWFKYHKTKRFLIYTVASEIRSDDGCWREIEEMLLFDKKRQQSYFVNAERLNHRCGEADMRKHIRDRKAAGKLPFALVCDGRPTRRLPKKLRNPLLE